MVFCAVTIAITLQSVCSCHHPLRSSHPLTMSSLTSFFVPRILDITLTHYLVHFCVLWNMHTNCLLVFFGERRRSSTFYFHGF
ncbi:hypothetical protein AHAS_Ahas14G0058000 [Arachis hypogaea]